jgi:hypothetical protein
MRSLLLPVLVAVLALAAVAVPAQAQRAVPRGTATLTGTVTDAATGDPLPGVNVFIAESMRGTATDNDGRFRLDNVPLGAQRLVVSFIGYATATRDLNLREPRVYVLDFALDEETVELEGVVVYAERDEKWLRRFERFKEEFLGETPNAEATTISNPEVLSFKGGLGTLEAFAEGPLVIENQALGYRVEYVLEDFKTSPSRTQYDGEPLFEELEGTPEEQARWAEARRQAFLGSFHHLMLAMLTDRAEGQGFKLWHRPQASPGRGGGNPFMAQASIGGQRTPADTDDFMQPGEVPSERVLDFEGFVEVRYLGERETEAYQRWRAQAGGRRRGPQFQTSYFWLEQGPATVDYKGEIVERYGVTVSGYFAFERMADSLPKEYRPGR